MVKVLACMGALCPVWEKRSLGHFPCSHFVVLVLVIYLGSWNISKRKGTKTKFSVVEVISKVQVERLWRSRDLAKWPEPSFN